MSKRNLLIAFLSACLAAALAHGQEKPRPEERKGRPPEKAAKDNKWDRGQKKGQFNQAAKVDKAKEKKIDREDKTKKGGGARVEKADKWDRKQITKKFNDAANPPNNPPPPPPNKNGGGNASPPSGPKGPKPPKP